MSAEPKRRAVFLDRDGTLMEDAHYLSDPAGVRVFPGAREALQRLKDAGYLLIVVTNQSGIGRGLFSVADYDRVQAEFLRQIGEHLIDASYFAPEAPHQPSDRRKPEPGMLLEAALSFHIDLPSSWIVGDKMADVEAGRRAGTRTILVLTGYGAAQRTEESGLAARDLSEAAALILGND